MTKIDFAKLAKKDRTYKTRWEYENEEKNKFLRAFGHGVRTRQELTDLLINMNLIEKKEELNDAIKELSREYSEFASGIFWYTLIEVENCNGIGYKFRITL